MSEDGKVHKIALLGLGTVGMGVYKLVEERQKDEFYYKTGTRVEIKKILVRNLAKKRPQLAPKVILTDQWSDILNDEEIDIIVEVMGGIEPARSYILEALNAKKNVVTANKDLLAEHGKELFDTAKANKRDLLFEASVAGAIPIIRPLKQCLAGNNIDEIMGLVNGTTNYILTKMTSEGMDFAEALAKATELGYAEADPTADIEGYDAARKVAILASIAFHSRVVLDNVYVEGITAISAHDIRYATEAGYTMKLIGVAKNTKDGIEARVHPMLIPSSHPLAAVNDSFNAIFVHADAAGEVMFYGRGAGELPTASAVVGDIIDVTRNIEFSSLGRISCSCYKNLPIKNIEQIESMYFLRIECQDEPGVLARIAKVFGDNQVSISQFIQKDAIDGVAELVIITHKVFECDIRKSVAELGDLDIVHKVSSIIRVYG